jgi:hypothetical protein
MKKLREVIKKLVPDAQTAVFMRHNRQIWSDWQISNPSGELLVDLCSIPETLISYSYFLNILAKRQNAEIKSFSSKSRLPFHVYHNVYRSFNTRGHVAVRLNDEQRRRAEDLYRKHRPSIQSKTDLMELVVDGIHMGIDIYEAYLRYLNRPTLDLVSKQADQYIREGLEIYVFWSDYLKTRSVKAVVVSHDCYSPLNILCKLAYRAKIPVYMPNARGITLARAPFSNFCHFPKLRELFQNLPHEKQKAGKELAKRQIERRLSGEVGVDMPYSTKSAYHDQFTETRLLQSSDRVKILICSHCFFDNPQAYGRILFEDFYEWLCFLGRVSEKTQYDWYIKMHPDPLPGTEDVIREIISKYPKINFLPSTASHKQLVREGIQYVLTAYGSVGHEYPAMGVQVINAGYNPRIAYDFNWHPKTIQEYEQILLSLKDLPKKKIDLDDLYEFYYIYHEYGYVDDLIFDSHRRYTEGLSKKDPTGLCAYTYFLGQFSDEKHRQISDRIEKFIESGKTHLLSREFE